MMINAGRMTIIFLCCMVVLIFGSIASKAYAVDTCDGSGDCNIAGNYQKNSKTILDYDDTAGYTHLFLGEAGTSYQSGINNLFIGDDAGRDFTVGRHNVFIGYEAASYGVCTDCYGGDDGRRNTAVGWQANAFGTMSADNTVIGTMAGIFNEGYANTFLGSEAGKMTTTGEYNIFIGLNAGAGHYTVPYWRPIRTGNDNIHIGTQTEALSDDLSSTIAIGSYALVEESNQMVVGSYYPEYNMETGLIRSSFWGSGVRSTNPQDFRFNATGGNGTNISGANLIIAGGKSTGSASGGSIKLQTSPSGTSGSNQNSLQDRMVIDSDGNVTIGDGTTPVAPLLSFDALYDDCDLSYNSGSDWLYMNCGIWPEIVYLRGAQVWLDAPAYGTLRSKANQQLNLQSPIIYLTGTDSQGNTNDSNVKVGIGTSSPQSKLAVSGLTNTPPDTSGPSYIVCIDPSGNMWVDDDGTNDCQ